MPEIPSGPIDLTNCDREPIHILGAVQPFGFLIAFTTDWLVARASSNIEQFIGFSPERVLGKRADSALSGSAVHVIRNMASMLRGSDAVERKFHVQLQDDGPPFDVAVHFSGSLLVVEAEPASAEPSGDSSSLVRSMMQRIRDIEDVQKFLEEGARQVRAITGFDRVMVYRFDQMSSGEVVAESRSGHVESYLGLNYPASDIPVQARALYLRNLFRVIADVGAEPVSIVPQLDPSGAPIDLSMSILRSVSPIHIEYLKNMGIAASLSISIVVDGKLWGLFACHHYAPRLPDFFQRTTAELFGIMFSLILESRERQAVAGYELSSRALADRLMGVLAEDATLLSNAEWLGNVLSETIPCDGVGVLVDGNLSLSGSTPSRAEFLDIVNVLNLNPASRVFHSESIGAFVPGASAYAARASGLLAIPISRLPRDYVVLFRRERIESVRWAGNPEKPVELGPNGARLTPRKSFEEWAQIVQGKSLPFTEAQVRVAEGVRATLLEVILRMSEAAGEERRRADERQNLLIAELNHRVRNILALIRGLVSQTRRKGSDAFDMIETLDLRIQALARAHDQITSDHWDGGSLRGLCQTEIAAFVGGKADRVSLSGEDVGLDSAAFTVVALVIHELVTNSAKYGALSDNGTVEIDWHRTAEGALAVSWREKGGPPVQPPTRRGFGSTIIERSIPHELKGVAEVRHAVTGLEADFVIPAHFLMTAAPGPTVMAKAHPPASSPDATLAGKAVLLVEDSLLIATDCEDILRSLGAGAVYLASSIAEAERLIAERPIDFAILDLNLGRETSLPIADLLKRRRTPFLFATGYGELSNVNAEYAGCEVITKPYTIDDIRRGVLRTLSRRP